MALRGCGGFWPSSLSLTGGATNAENVVENVQDVVAATWYKFGFVYDPTAPATQRVTSYVDNVAQGTFITQTNIETAEFPDSDLLKFCATIKVGADTVADTFDMDWWAFGQINV